MKNSLTPARITAFNPAETGVTLLAQPALYSKVSTYLRWVFRVNISTSTHQTKTTNPVRLNPILSIVVQIREVTNHMPVFMAESTERQFISDVGNLIVRSSSAGHQLIIGKQTPRVWP